MRNSSTSRYYLGIGKAILNMTYSKLLTLNNVLHITNIRKNLVFDSLLSKNSFKMVFENDKLVLFINKMFKEKRYLSDGFFKMNIITIVTKVEMNNNNNNNNNNNTSSFYLLECVV
jgi:hypothetical protein